MKYKVIANPASGKGTGKKLIPGVAQQLSSYGLSFDLVQTEYPWHAAELAQQAANEGYDAVIAVGGDGTINEVLNGLMLAAEQGSAKQQQMPCLGIICIGRGNDFAFGAGLPINWQTNCQIIAQGKPRKIDVGCIYSDCLDGPFHGRRYFGNGIGIGFDAVVNVQATKTRLTGFLGYTVAALRTILLHFYSPLVRIECDQTTITQHALMISVMNGQRMGGGFLMAPDSTSNDGMFDLCIANQVSRPTILRMIPRFMRGSQGSHPAIRFERSRRVVITALNGDDLPTHVDGETICSASREIRIEILPRQIDLIRAPENG